MTEALPALLPRVNDARYGGWLWSLCPPPPAPPSLSLFICVSLLILWYLFPPHSWLVFFTFYILPFLSRPVLYLFGYYLSLIFFVFFSSYLSSFRSFCLLSFVLSLFPFSFSLSIPHSLALLFFFTASFALSPSSVAFFVSVPTTLHTPCLCLLCLESGQQEVEYPCRTWRPYEAKLTDRANPWAHCSFRLV